MNGKSLTPQIEKLEQLKQILPEAFSEGKIDWEKLRATLGESINFANERYVLNWAGKSDAFRVMQQPATKTLIPVEEKSVRFEDTENIFIEGENMEVLKVLQKSYFGKVKMIYIDPPYNTGNDSFIYPDKFSETKDEYQKRVGDKDEEGYMTSEGMFRKNSKENGQYHSNWLSMMMPRLYLAKNLLREDGVIFVSIDDNEVHNLRMLMNEIFGEENFVATLVWQKIHSIKNDAKFFSENHEYVLVFVKNVETFSLGLLSRTTEMDARYKNPDNDPRGEWQSGDLVASGERSTGHFIVKSPISGKEFDVPQSKHWVYSESNINQLILDNQIWFGIDGNSFPRKKRFLKDVQAGRTANTLWLSNEVGHNQTAAKEVKKIFDEEKIFDFPKPVDFIKQMLQLTTQSEDIILDFFAGSATTAQAVMQLNKEDSGNRKYILVQMPELCDEKSEAYKAGYKTIADIAKERIRRAGKKIQDETDAENKKKKSQLAFEETSEIAVDTGFKMFKLAESNFKQWQQPKNNNTEELVEQMKLFIDPVAENAITRNMAYELLLKSGKDLNADVTNNFSPKGEGSWYSVNSGEMAFFLESVSQEIIDAVVALKPKKVIALDRIFKGNDQLKTNTALQMKDAGVEFKTI